MGWREWRCACALAFTTTPARETLGSDNQAFPPSWVFDEGRNEVMNVKRQLTLQSVVSPRRDLENHLLQDPGVSCPSMATGPGSNGLATRVVVVD